MILLDKKEYYKASEPLQQVEINHLFADAVVLGHVDGRIYVDNTIKPDAFYIEHPYGMSLLFGSTTNESFNKWLIQHALNIHKIRNRFEWLQAFPKAWNEYIASEWSKHLIKQKDNEAGMQDDKIEENTRVNFRFNKAIYLEFKHKYIQADVAVVTTDRQMFESMQGSVVPARFWNNADDFLEKAVAFSVMDNGSTVACTAFSAFVIGNQLEIGIETSDNYRGKGYAASACSALIDYCLANSYEPVWGCKLENKASYLLAQKLGFEPTVYWPFFRLLK